ncbi:hypothetical protein M2404_001716 [Rheinheimera pacifica]|nr:hypothetical protein [Rheinheimera pacifica]
MAFIRPKAHFSLLSYVLMNHFKIRLFAGKGDP